MSLFDTIANVGKTVTEFHQEGVFNKISAFFDNKDQDVTLPDRGFGGVFGKYFDQKPTKTDRYTMKPDKVERKRTSDFFMESLKEEAVKTGKKIADFGVEVAQGTARSGARVGLGLFNVSRKAIGEEPVEKIAEPFDFSGDPNRDVRFDEVLQSILFGDDAVNTFTESVDIFSEEAEKFTGVPKLSIKPYAWPVVLGFTALDFTGAGGEAKALNKLAASSVTDDIIKILKNEIVGISDDVIETVARGIKDISDPSMVKSFLDDVITEGVETTAKVVSKELQQVSKFNTADDFIGTQKKVFRGGDFNPNKIGIPVTTDRNIAKSFPFELPPDKALFKGSEENLLEKVGRGMTQSQVDELLTKTQQIREAGVKEFFISKQAKILGDKTGVPEKLLDDSFFDFRNLSKWAKEKGFDAIDFDKLEIGFGEQEIRVLNSDILKTKQELTDIFEKTKGLIKKATKKGLVDDVVDIKNGGRFEDSKITTTRDRGYITSIKESPKTTPDVARKISSNYNPTTNKETLGKASKMITTNLNEAIRFAKDTTVPATAESNAVAQLLVQRAQDVKNWDEAIELVEITAKRATTQGQAIQALSIWNRMSTEGILQYAEKTFQRASKATGQAVKLTEEIADDLVRMAQEIETTKDPVVKAQKTALMHKRILDEIPSSFWKKVATAQTLFQLLNPKTLIRNIGGNTGFAALENVTDVVAASLDSPLSFLTGKRSTSLPSLVAQGKGFAQGLEEGVKEAMMGIDTLGLATRLDIPVTPVFKGRVGKAAEKTLNVVLRGPDRAAYKAAYDGSIYKQMKAAAINNNGIALQVPTAEMLEVAHHDGLFRTFQDENVLSKGFSAIKRGLNLGLEFGLGDIVLKYPRTPANLLARGIDYSPAGFANSVYQISRPLLGTGPFNQKAFIESFSRALTGTTGLVGMGALMHRLGLITGKFEKDPDIREVQRETGLGQYKINASAVKRFALSGMDVESAKLRKGDTLFSFDWFQPLAIGVSMGANIDENMQKDDQKPGFVETLMEGAATGFNTVGEQPLVQNLTRFLSAGTREEPITGPLKFAAGQIPSSFVPTLLNQINQYVDNTQRNTYDVDSIRQAFKGAQKRLPVAAGQLPERVGVFGETNEVYQNASNNLFNVFFNPAFKTTYDPTPEAQLVLDLFEQTGETKQAPRLVGKTATVNGKKVKLGPKTIGRMQVFVGTATRNYFHQLANSAEFQELSNEDKIKHMSNVLSDVGSAAKIVILGDRPKRNPSMRTQVIIRDYMGQNQ